MEACIRNVDKDKFHTALVNRFVDISILKFTSCIEVMLAIFSSTPKLYQFIS